MLKRSKILLGIGFILTACLAARVYFRISLYDKYNFNISAKQKSSLNNLPILLTAQDINNSAYDVIELPGSTIRSNAAEITEINYVFNPDMGIAYIELVDLYAGVTVYISEPICIKSSDREYVLEEYKTTDWQNKSTFENEFSIASIRYIPFRKIFFMTKKNAEKSLLKMYSKSMSYDGADIYYIDHPFKAILTRHNKMTDPRLKWIRESVPKWEKEVVYAGNYYKDDSQLRFVAVVFNENSDSEEHNVLVNVLAGIKLENQTPVGPKWRFIASKIAYLEK